MKTWLDKEVLDYINSLEGGSSKKEVNPEVVEEQQSGEDVMQHTTTSPRQEAFHKFLSAASSESKFTQYDEESPCNSPLKGRRSSIAAGCERFPTSAQDSPPSMPQQCFQYQKTENVSVKGYGQRPVMLDRLLSFSDFAADSHDSADNGPDALAVDI